MSEETARPQIYAQISKVMSEIGAVEKNRKNEQQKYQFRGIEDMYLAAHPAMVKHGVFCVPSVLEHKAETYERATGYEGKMTIWRHVTVKIQHRFYAPDGSFVDVVTMGEGLDNSDKATNKATSGAMKYALIELFTVPTQDIEDADRTTPEVGNAGVERTTAPTKIGRPAQSGGGAVKGTPKPPVTSPAAVSASAELNAALDAFDAESAPEPPGGWQGASLREPGSDDDDMTEAAITLPQQKSLHVDYRAAFRGDKKLADVNLRRNLKSLGFTGPDGEGTTKTIPAMLYPEVHRKLMIAANHGGLME